jgi:hypothetical protein
MPMKTTAEWQDVDVDKFRNDIYRQDRPAVFRGLVKDWPAVREGRKSPQALCDYIRSFDLGRPIQTAVGPPEIKGRLFYNDSVDGFNYERVHETFQDAIARILSNLNNIAPPAIYAGAVSTAEGFPGFAKENTLPLVNPSVVSRIWAGNAVTAPTHYDTSDNIACVVAGHRRCTFFPPEQLPNLYVGPLEFTPAGQPTSMVRVGAPDMARYPRYAEALAAAESADLGPGDAVFIPNMWWHNIESLDPFNILVNYWWYDGPRGPGSPFTALVYGILSLRDLPASRREIWRRMFDHYVFQTRGDPAEHLPPDRRGMLGRLTRQVIGAAKAWLQNELQRL